MMMKRRTRKQRYNRDYYILHREKLLGEKKDRYHTDPEYRKKALERSALQSRSLLGKEYRHITTKEIEDARKKYSKETTD